MNVHTVYGTGLESALANIILRCPAWNILAISSEMTLSDRSHRAKIFQ